MRRHTVAILTLGSMVAARKLPAKGADMQTSDSGSIAEITEAISARLHAQWDGWKNRDAASNNASIADDFTCFWPDGSRHVGKPTAQQIAEQPIGGINIPGLVMGYALGGETFVTGSCGTQ